MRLLLETLPSHAPVYIVYPTGPGAPPTLGFLSSARITARLNLVSRRMFPLPACLQSTALAESRNPAPASNYVTPSSSERQVYTLDRLTRLVWESSGRLVSVQTGEQGRTQGDVNLDALHDSLLSADPLLKQRLENVQKAFPALNERVNTRERAQGEAKRRKISNRSAAAALKARLAGGPLPNKDEESGEELGEEPELVFLGTGSAEPSKYRGASAIYVRIGGKNSGEDRGVNRITCPGFLLDCGEGTWGHLVRQLGPAQALKVVINLGFVWISHRHADHMSGLLRIIAIYSQEVGDEEENKVQERRPLLIIGPNALGLWLQKAVPAMLGIEKTSQLIRFIHCGDITDGSGLQKSPSIQTACQSSGLTLIQAIRVRHCSDAWGIVLGHDTGWSLAYSGDTEPCDALSRAAQGVSVLIHEATFEPRLHGEARRKRHSTTLEALSVAREMKACATVLTHFSQRYPKFPEGLSSDDKDGDESNLIAVAFDGMRLPFSCIPALSAVTKCVELLLALKSDTVDGNQFKH